MSCQLFSYSMKWQFTSQERRTLNMSVSKISKEDRKRRNQTKNQILTSVGCLFVVGVAAFSIMGTKFAINNINRDAQDAIVYAKQQANNNSTNNHNDDVVKNENNTDKTDDKNQWSDEQITWMQENHIRYNEYGQPVDENGNIVVDPTVPAINDDISVSHEVSDVPTDDDSISDDTFDENIPMNDVSISETISAEKPETNTDWVLGKDWLIQSDNGDYEYVVRYGDTLGKLCKTAGFSLEEIIEYNQIVNPDIIHVGQTIRFPQAGPNGAAGNPNFDLG